MDRIRQPRSGLAAVREFPASGSDLAPGQWRPRRRSRLRPGPTMTARTRRATRATSTAAEQAAGRPATATTAGAARPASPRKRRRLTSRRPSRPGTTRTRCATTRPGATPRRAGTRPARPRHATGPATRRRPATRRTQQTAAAGLPCLLCCPGAPGPAASRRGSDSGSTSTRCGEHQTAASGDNGRTADHGRVECADGDRTDRHCGAWSRSWLRCFGGR